VADSVKRLQRGTDAECRLFQSIAEQARGAGRSEPGGTRQGIYAATPSGVLLASNNNTTPEKALGLLREGLAQWSRLSRKRRLGGGPIPVSAPCPPAGGLVLQVAVRDLPRGSPADSARDQRWNRDFAWFTKAEAASLAPRAARPGLVHRVPPPIVERLARFHLLDIVDGETEPFPASAVEVAELTATVAGRGEHIVAIELAGRTRVAERGCWPVDDVRDESEPGKQSRGYDARLAGRATWDRRRGRFTAFALVAVGRRWGGTQFNHRSDDLAPAPMGVALTLLDAEAAHQLVPPAYGAGRLPQ
jgi:hypothetical protein